VIDLDVALRDAKRDEKYVAAICPGCGGWTMYCSPDSDSAKDWIRREYVCGSLIVFWKNPDSLGVACPSTGENCTP